MLRFRVLKGRVDPTVRYYAGGDDLDPGEAPDSAWQGKGAEALGLAGPVDAERLRQLLAGQVSPDSPTCRTSTRKDSHVRIGIDLTFSAPKSVSLQALVALDPAALGAHDRAVDRAVAVAEERAQARRWVNGKSQVEDTRNLAVAKFRHQVSRELDPQLHTHCLVLNLTRRADGAWRALLNDEIVRATRYLTAVYRAELAVALQRAGYALRHGREGLFELAHVERAQLAAFSRRAARIEEHLARRGLTRETASFRQRELAGLKDRPGKRPVDRGRLLAEWQAKARELGIDLGWRTPPPGRGLFAAGPVDVESFPRVRAEGARRGVRFAVAHLTERQAVIGERELLDVALKHSIGKATLADVQREVDRQLAVGYLVRESPHYLTALHEAGAEPRSRNAWVRALVERGMEGDAARRRVDLAIDEGGLVPAERRFTTQAALERERRILRIERQGRGQVSPIADREAVGRRLGSSDLTPGQRAAVELIATATDRVVGVQGHAGTGKSHMLDTAKRLVEESGFRVVALAPYASQVRVLRELGVEARTLASFLAARESHLDPRTVLVIDEAGTVATRHLDQALRIAEGAGTRVVLLGDTQQTKAIEAGRPFDQLQAAGMRTALMEEIRRQVDPALRQAVALAARGEAAASLRYLPDLRQIKDDHERRRAIAADLAGMAPEERSRTIVVAGTNEARREINRAVRENLGLAGQGLEFATLARRDTTRAERAFSRNYSPGDLIQPERDYPRAGLRRGELYEVTRNGPGNRLTVRGTREEVIEFSPMSFRQLSLYAPERTELAPGDRIRITRNDAGLDLANGDRFTVLAVSREAVSLADGRRRVELPAGRPLHLDHAYATTIHSSQGTTADRVLIDAATRSRTTARDTFYVAISRARHEVRIYTDDLARLPLAVERESRKHAALDLERC
ncbi:MAG TPA: MobF family relaxase [Anaeromyxobacter sp.]|nr:MobF family relaxase [Anaeromyxobacter sp.]